MRVHPLSSLPLYLNGPIQGLPLQTVMTSPSYPSTRTPFLGSRWPLQPHLDVLHSASDHVLTRTIWKLILYSCTYFLPRLQTPWRQRSCLVLLWLCPQQDIAQSKWLRAETNWETVSWTPLHHPGEDVWEESHLVSTQRSAWLRLTNVPMRPRGIPASLFINRQWEKETDWNVRLAWSELVWFFFWNQVTGEVSHDWKPFYFILLLWEVIFAGTRK